MGFLCTDTRDIPTTLRVNDRWKMFDSIKKSSILSAAKGILCGNQDAF